MVLFQAALALGEFLLGRLAQSRLGVLGLLLLAAVAVGVRARHTGLAVGAVVVFTLLMTQA
ncbi:hypothetical protein AB0945_22305 [Streptomyces sp. NPDC005474]|uniref:hypothetical protein n=1 Tax=Streptomyces sp. NPDC005474 TaxID=3154878 RepID=UPI0034536B33